LLKEKSSRTCYSEMQIMVSEPPMHRKMIRDGSEVIPEGRKNKLAMLKKAISEGTYKVQPEAIAEKMFKDLLFELALTPSYGEYQICREN
jgi:anti-sigma28 factor (negative regulator of flagellin synthesis)